MAKRLLDELDEAKKGLPDDVRKDIEKRVNDWLLSGGEENHRYIENQLKFAKRYKEIMG